MDIHNKSSIHPAFKSRPSNRFESSSNKQDARIIEYCPKIFNNLRKIDDISHEIIKK